MSATDNKKISELSAASTLTGAELVPIVQSGVTVRTTAAALSAGVGTVAGPGVSVDGDIVVFSGVGGTILADSGTKVTDLAPGNVDYLVKTANGTLTAERVVTDTASIVADWGTSGQVKFNVQTGSGTGVAPNDVDYLVGAATSALSAERVVTNTPSIIWDVSTAGQAKANVVGFGTATIPTDFKDSVAVATTANITLSGEQTIASVLTSGSRVLVKNQTTGSENGIYVSAAGAWSRATDADTSAEVTSGMLVYVEAGTVSAGLIYILSTTGTITLGSTSLTFTAIVMPFSFFVGSTVAGTSYTTVLTDSGKRLNLTNAATKTITIPPASSVAYAVNTEIEVFNAGSGTATIAPGAGVTINSYNSILTVPQYNCVKLKKRATPNTWDMTAVVEGNVLSTQSIISGAGLTGGGDLSADRTLAVGAGTGITVNADDVAVNINGLTADASPDAAADYVMTYDASATTLKKVLVENLKPIESLIVACSDETTALTAGTAKVSWNMPYAFTLTQIPRASLVTAQTSGSIFTVDINEAGTSIISTKLTIDNTEKTSTTAATPAVSSDTSLADDALMTVDIDQIGDGTAKGLKINLVGYRT